MAAAPPEPTPNPTPKPTPTPKRKTTRLIVVAIWAAAMAGAILYLRCGTESSQPKLAPRRCLLVLDAKGISEGGHAMNRETAVELCKKLGGADITVGSGARQADVLQLQGELTAAHID